MTASNFPAVMDEIFRHEGGLSLVRADPGNWTGGKVGAGELRGTKYGIAAHAHPGVDIRNLTRAEAREIYRRQYWRPIRGDEMPEGIDLATMDPAVNSGVSRGAAWMQRALGVDADGRIGPITLAAARQADPVPAIRKACAIRMGFLRGLRTWSDFGRGWSRRVASVEAVGVRMALEARGAPAGPVLDEGRGEAEKAAQRDQAGAGGSVAAGGGGATLADLPAWGVVGLIVAAFLVAVILMGDRRHQKDRAEAYRREAERAKS